jgi:hypothetical protein
MDSASRIEASAMLKIGKVAEPARMSVGETASTGEVHHRTVKMRTARNPPTAIPIARPNAAA